MSAGFSNRGVLGKSPNVQIIGLSITLCTELIIYLFTAMVVD